MLAAGLMLLASVPAGARDYGQQGAVFPILEEDFLRVIERRLRQMEASGALVAANRRLAEKVKGQVLSPPPVPGIAAAGRARTWLFDPSIALHEDIRDGDGRVIAVRGTRVNPLDHVALRHRLVFLDGEDEIQVRWAMASTRPESVKLILTNGSAFRLMERHRRRFYFDQAGTLSARFGITRVPAVVEQEGRRLRIREVPMDRRSGGEP